MAAQFVKCLTEADVESTLSLPLDWLPVLPPFPQGRKEVEFYASDRFGSDWEFCYYVRKIGRYRKPVIHSEGWLRFVNHKDLKAGDKIILDSEVHEYNGSNFKIRAQKLNPERDQWDDV